MNTSPALDQEVFEELYESVCEQQDVVASLYQTFLKTADQLIDTLRVSGPGASCEKTLHALKGSAAMMGAMRMARLATDLQQTCATLDQHTLQGAVRQLDTELASVRASVHMQLASLRTAQRSD